LTWRRAAPWIALFAALGALGGGPRLPFAPAAPTAGGGRTGAALGRVTHVVDGDTIDVRLDRGGAVERVRYIGIDTPESVKPNTPVQCYARAASHRNARLVGGQRVRLAADVEPRDRYGRLLAYVYRVRDGLFVNAALVRDGYALTLTIPPNVAHATLFRRLQRSARAHRRGLWGHCRG